jgi:hemolysin activation/secretion protein
MCLSKARRRPKWTFKKYAENMGLNSTGSVQRAVTVKLKNPQKKGIHYSAAE